jgi:hypothetical protein
MRQAGGEWKGERGKITMNIIVGGGLIESLRYVSR